MHPLKLGQSASALTDAERAGALGGGKAHFRRAEALVSLRRYEEALEAFEAALANAVSDCAALTLLSFMLLAATSFRACGDRETLPRTKLECIVVGGSEEARGSREDCRSEA